MFLERYFPASKVGSIRKEICGLQSLDRSMIDGASEGALVDKTHAAARSLISNMDANSQQFGIRQDPTPPPKSANEVNTSNANQLGQQLAQLTSVQMTQASIKSLENQVEQLATSYNSGKQYDPPIPPMPIKLSSKPQVDCSVDEDVPPKPTDPTQPTPKPTFVTPPPFPSRLKKTKKDEVDKEILDTFRKVEVNIPLLDAIKQVPRYAKFLKDLCTNKHKLRCNEKDSVGENVSAGLQKKLPPKCKDPATFTIPCTIGNKRIERCLLDLGASINVMPFSIYTSLNLDPLEETGAVIQLADRSNAYHRGVIEDVLVQVNELVFLADFYVLDMEDESIPCSIPILLGKTFMKTARTKFDVHDSTLTMEFDGETIRFNIFEAMRYPSDVHAIYSLDVLDILSQ
ncbi:uncharacterized protein LOC133785379 [Humulus lupulus]|uniref:uncharacterized protein LOC133785379 n=1 Tax=Humulus lupulus TaxID=3486 RepID=UPI002B40B2F1|nr:uncharacterized protein LOC133785379 [Humulus lupulus]